jgi:hypothetical protein
MSRATHTGYKHPRHLRVVEGDLVLCVAPSSSDYDKLNRAGLPKWKPEED